MKQKTIRILIPIFTLSIFLAGLFVIQNTALASQVCKKYKEYKNDFKNKQDKQQYFKIKDLKKHNKTLYEFYKSFYKLHKKDTKAQIQSLSQKDQDIFNNYESYKGYKNYRYYQDKCNKDQEDNNDEPITPEDPFVCGEFDAIAERTFTPDTIVIPMDDKQDEPLKVFGFLHMLNREGVSYYRILQDGTTGDILKTDSFPSGSEYLGGPIFIRDSIPSSVTDEFPDVTQDTLTESYTSDMVTMSETAPEVLLIKSPIGDFGDVDDVLDDMGIPFISVLTSDVDSDPEIINEYDIIIDNSPGWVNVNTYESGMTDDVILALQNMVRGGGEAIFTDIDLLDLEKAFPDYVGIGGNWLPSSTIYPLDFHPKAETPSQFAGTSPINVKIPAAGVIAYQPAPVLPNNWLDVRPLFDTDNYALFADLTDRVPGYALPAFYFPYEHGVVEGFGFFMKDQEDSVKQNFGNQLLTLRCQ